MGSDQSPKLSPVRVAHYSDNHLGVERYAAVAANGHNQRGADIVQAWVRANRQIVDWDPPLVINAGDIADVSRPKIKYMVAARQGVEKVASLRPDGTRRQYIIDPGNHDQPRDLKELCWLELLRGIPGVHVAKHPYDQITFDPERDGCDPALKDVVVHCVPSSGLRVKGVFDQIEPVEDKINILVAHGVAEGSELFARAVGRTWPVPTELLEKPWDYVALGDYHKCGPVQLGSAVVDPNKSSHIWYSGSTETISVSDMGSDTDISQRNWLAVTVNPRQLPDVQRRFFPVRRVVKLRPIRVADDPDITQEQLVAQLKNNIATTPVAGTIAVQKVIGVSRDLWATCDTNSVRAAAGDAMHYELQVIYAKPEMSSSDGPSEQNIGFGDVPKFLTEEISKRTDDPDMASVLEEACRRFVRDALADGAPTELDAAGQAPTDGDASDAPDERSTSSDDEAPAQDQEAA